MRSFITTPQSRIFGFVVGQCILGGVDGLTYVVLGCYLLC